jgi:hypothetical protein
MDMQSTVVYNVVQRNEQWHVLKDGADEPLGRYQDKADAVDRARDLAQREESAILRITAVGGSIQSELAYGSDPMAMEGTRSAG